MYTQQIIISYSCYIARTCVRQDIGKRIKTTYMTWPNAKNCLHDNEEVVFMIAESTFLLPQDKQS